MTRQMKKVSGWLALLIGWMVVFRPLGGVALWQEMHAATERDPALALNSTMWSNTSLFWFVFLFLAVLNIYGGLRLWSDRTPRSVNAAILILWLSVPLALSAVLINRAYLAGNVLISDVLYYLGLNVALATVWTAYLRRSRRVAETYRDETVSHSKADAI